MVSLELAVLTIVLNSYMMYQRDGVKLCHFVLIVEKK